MFCFKAFETLEILKSRKFSGFAITDKRYICFVIQILYNSIQRIYFYEVLFKETKNLFHFENKNKNNIY